MRTSKRIFLNAASNWVGSVVQAGLGFLLVPFLLNQLGRSSYGLIALTGVIVSFTTLADLGLRSALGRNLAEQVGKKDIRRFNELVSTGMATYVLIGSFCAAFLMTCAPFLARAFKAPSDLMPQAVFLIRWYGGISVLMSFIAPVYGATITSNNRFDVANYIDMGTSIAQGVGFFAVLGLTGTGLYGWGAVALTAQSVRILAKRHAALVIWPTHRVGLAFIRRDSFHSLFSLGWRMCLFQVTNLLSVRSDPIVITSFLGPSGVALYTPGLSLPTHARKLVDTLRSQLHPLATTYHVTGRNGQLHKVLFQGTRYTLLMGIPVCVMLAAFADPIMRLWIGKTPIGEEYHTVALVLVAWAVIDLLNYSAGSQWAVLLGMNRLDFLVWTQVVAGVLNVLASIYLVGYTRLGVIGVVLPTMVITAVRRPIIAAYTAWVCGTTVRRYCRESYLRPIIVLVLDVAAAVVASRVIAPHSLLSLGACVATVGIVWAPACWWIGFNRNDRMGFRALFGPARTKEDVASRRTAREGEQSRQCVAQ